MRELANVASIKSQKGMSDMLGAALAELLGPTRRELGCRAYELHRSVHDSDVWMIYERWGSQADLDAHLAQPYVQRFIGRLNELVAGTIDVQSFLHIS